VIKQLVLAVVLSGIFMVVMSFMAVMVTS